MFSSNFVVNGMGVFTSPIHPRIFFILNGEKKKYAPRQLPHGSLYPISIRTLLPIEGWKMGSSDIGLRHTIRWSLPLGPSVNTCLIFSPWCIWLVPLGNLSPRAPWDWSNLESLGVSVIQLQIKWKGIFGSSFKTIPPPCFFFLVINLSLEKFYSFVLQ